MNGNREMSRDRGMGGFKGEWMNRLVSGRVDSWKHMSLQYFHEAVSLPMDAGNPLLVHVPISWA